MEDENRVTILEHTKVDNNTPANDFGTKNLYESTFSI